ncbi:MAG: hypothetical protein JST19_17415, partial [Bacteroidetes bacterium]|nr:hypothetical protein [Bacteroidota bacterium]
LCAEFDISSTQNEQLKRKFRQLRDRNILVAKRLHPDYALLKVFDDNFLRLYNKIAGNPGAEKTAIFTDLLHMHCNRLFADEARKQEMILYYCLWRHYQSVAAMLTV